MPIAPSSRISSVLSWLAGPTACTSVVDGIALGLDIHCMTHRSSIAAFVEQLTGTIKLDLSPASHRVPGYPRQLGGSSSLKNTQIISCDYVHPAGWLAWDDKNPHKQFIDLLELLEMRRDVREIYRTWGGAALGVIRQNLELLPSEIIVQDETLLNILEREVDALLNENNSVFVELYHRIVLNQLGRQQNRLAPIAEEPSESQQMTAVDTLPTIFFNYSQQTPSTANLWSEFDSDDDLPDISDLLPAWVRATSVPRPTMRLWSELDDDSDELPDVSDMLPGWLAPNSNVAPTDGLIPESMADSEHTLSSRKPECLVIQPHSTQSIGTLASTSRVRAEPVGINALPDASSELQNSSSDSLEFMREIFQHHSEMFRGQASGNKLPGIPEESEENDEDPIHACQESESESEDSGSSVSPWSSPPHTPLDLGPYMSPEASLSNLFSLDLTHTCTTLGEGATGNGGPDSIKERSVDTESVALCESTQQKWLTSR